MKIFLTEKEQTPSGHWEANDESVWEILKLAQDHSWEQEVRYEPIHSCSRSLLFPIPGSNSCCSPFFFFFLINRTLRQQSFTTPIQCDVHCTVLGLNMLLREPAKASRRLLELLFGLVLVWAVGNNSIWSPVKHHATASAEKGLTYMGWKKALFWGHLRARIKAEIKKQTTTTCKTENVKLLTSETSFSQMSQWCHLTRQRLRRTAGSKRAFWSVFAPTLHSEVFCPHLLLPAMERKPPAPSRVAQSLQYGWRDNSEH